MADKVQTAQERFNLSDQDMRRVVRVLLSTGGVIQWDDAPYINEAVNWILDQRPDWHDWLDWERRPEKKADR